MPTSSEACDTTGLSCGRSCWSSTETGIDAQDATGVVARRGLELDGTRMQAVVLSPEISRHRGPQDTLVPKTRQSRHHHGCGRQQSGPLLALCARHHRGPRPEHASTRFTRELGRAICLLVKRSRRTTKGAAVPSPLASALPIPPADERASGPGHKPLGSHQVSGRRPTRTAARDGLMAVLAEPSTAGRGRDGPDLNGGEPMPTGPTPGKAKPGMTFGRRER